MNNTHWIYKFLFEKKYQILRHIAFWIFIYLDEFLSLLGVTSPIDGIHFVVFELIGDMLLVYFNIYYLLPKFLLKRRIGLYALLTFISIMFVLVFNYYLYGLNLEEDFTFHEYFIGSLATNVSLVGLAVVIRFFKMSYRNQTQIQALKESQLKTELAYLKSQINPHFLFNTLNNLYIMSMKKMDDLPKSIMQLSDLLRYQLYECDTERVSLASELEYIRNYISLEKLRRNNLDVHFEIEGPVNSKEIAPLIFIPFIENAFKYSNKSDGSKSFVEIKINIVQDKIHFSCINEIGDIKARDVGGIGIKNAKRRLELAYKDKHNVSIKADDNLYKLYLILE
ncbi:MAG: sensor histidine kinase [Saprospiraceae bacterium]|nr:sensor histidine kinase [Saprospiraceae bacterium]